MTNIQVSVNKNGKVTLLTVGKYCPDNIDVNVQVPPDQIPAYNRYASVATALTGTTTEADGPVGAYTDSSGGKHLILLADIASSSTIAINQSCTLHLNGHVLSFTTGDAHLNVTANSTIDGRVSGSEITKSGVTYTGSAKLVSAAANTHLTMIGGKYSMDNITSATFVIPIRTEAATAILDMDGCEVVSNGVGATSAKGAQVYGTVNITKCKFDVTAVSGAATAIHCLTGTHTIKGTTINVSSSGSTVSGIESFSTGGCNVTITDCIIDADGVGGAVACAAVSCVKNSTVNITGGTYWGAREAVNVVGTANIDGGTYKGCQHGGGYLGGSAVKVKNATFVNVEYTKNAGWNDYHHAAVYCGGNTSASDVRLDKCFFIAEKSAAYGLAAKATAASVYISNSSFGDNLNKDLRVDGGCYIYIGENVDYDTVYVPSGATAPAGTITTTNDNYGW